ncbi:RNA recognition motif-containing protein [Exophiala xenobiotica]|nr:RNA recognition motif-containing protein [Exophiala xenobiotica]
MASSGKRRKLSDGSYNAVPVVSDKPAVEEEAPSKDQRRSLFVRSLPASVTTERLTEHFSQSFPLKHATVVLDPQTKISKGFGFVTFADAEDAHAAVEQFNNSTLDGRKIKVELAQSRQRETEGGLKSSQNLTGVQLRAQREQTRTQGQQPRLIVRNLPWSIKTGDDLALLFRSYGKVKHAVVPNKSPRVQYGFGIVVLRGIKNAEKAIAGVNGKEVDGRTLAVDWAVDKDTWQQQQQAALDAESSPGGEEVTAEAKAGSTAESAAEAEGVEDVQADTPSADESEADDFEDVDDLDAEDEDLEMDGESQDEEQHDSKNDTTVFIRNLPFTADDESLREHFTTFGPVRYARVVYDPETERSRGTAFVCFYEADDAKACVKDAPKHDALAGNADNDKKRKGEPLKHSVLQNEATDPSGRYTLEGRVLQVSRALSKGDAERRANEASEKRDIRDRDKRRLYLLSEGSIPRGSQLYEQLGKPEIDIRESSARQRQRIIKNNPNLGLSLTRLSVRNLPRSIDGKALKALAREAVVGFAQDAKAGLRQPLSKEELRRGGEEEREAEQQRKRAGKGIVKQAKIVFEDQKGSKVQDGAGRSRGYGFIEYFSHRNALAGLRWLNGHMVKASGGERGKRLIVEFAIENAQVVQRRSEQERRAREHRANKTNEKGPRGNAQDDRAKTPQGKKRKHNDGDEKAKPETSEAPDSEEKNRVAKRNRIIAKKRQARKTRKS